MQKLDKIPDDVKTQGRPGSSSRIDWDTVLDGGVYRLEEGTDYTIKIASVRTAASKEAINRGCRARTYSTLDGKSLIVQAIRS